MYDARTDSFARSTAQVEVAVKEMSCSDEDKD
jgi:hypothetical protein